MNSFLELYSSSDYRLTNRDYYTSTWEYIISASDYLIPFQWTGDNDARLTITKIDKDDSETVITGKFWSSTTQLTSWTLTGTGSWTVGGVAVSCSSTVANDIITSNQFTLAKGQSFWFINNLDQFTNLANWNLYIKKGASIVYTKTGWDTWPIEWDDGNTFYTATEAGSDYTVVIEVTTSTEVVTLVIPTGWTSKFYNSGTYWWYDGSQLSLAGGVFDDIFRLKLEHDTYTYFTDWIDPCGFTGKTKIEVSSSYDYGGIKYVDGYEQWMYKNATVRRNPKAEISILGDTLNGKRENEKITSTIRYTLKTKCTEAEFEALVHAMGGDIEITDKDGKVYDCQNLALEDPSWYRSNAVFEMSFIDGNNLNVWTRNNATL